MTPTADDAPRRWSGYVGAGVGWDGNINAATERNFLHLDTRFDDIGRDGTAVPLEADERARSGAGLSLWGGVEYEHPLGAGLGLRLGADAVRLDYGGRRDDWNWLGLYLGPRWSMDADTEVGLLVEAQRQWSGGRPESDALGLRVEVRHSLARHIDLYAAAAWRWEDDRLDDAFDGSVEELFLGAVWTATPALRLRAAFGHDRERPKDRNWRNAGVRDCVGASLDLPLGFAVDAGGEWRRTRYEDGGRDGPHYTGDGGKRRDRTRTLRLSVTNRDVAVGGFTPRLALTDEVRTPGSAAGFRRTVPSSPPPGGASGDSRSMPVTTFPSPLPESGRAGRAAPQQCARLVDPVAHPRADRAVRVPLLGHPPGAPDRDRDLALRQALAQPVQRGQQLAVPAPRTCLPRGTGQP